MSNSDKKTHSNWVVSVGVAAAILVNGWVLMAVEENNKVAKETQDAIMNIKVSQATYYERVDRLQEAQALTAKLVYRLRKDVLQHSYDIEDLKRRTK